MTPEQIKDAVENYHQYLSKREKLEKRMISVSGRDPEQELLLSERLEEVEVIIDTIHDVMDPDDSFLDSRDSTAIILRTEGFSVQKIREVFGLSHQAVYLLLNKSYIEMAAYAESRR